MIRCSNPSCPHGMWFHLECLNLPAEEVPDGAADWWCNPACQSTNRQDNPFIVSANNMIQMNQQSYVPTQTAKMERNSI